MMKMAMVAMTAVMILMIMMILITMAMISMKIMMIMHVEEQTLFPYLGHRSFYGRGFLCIWVETPFMEVTMSGS